MRVFRKYIARSGGLPFFQTYMSSSRETPLERRFFLGVFLLALVAHGVLAFHNLKMPFLAGHEFRQSQTALIAYYIDKESNFSPLYEQPILGKPWLGFMLEFPLYQWCVVGLSRATGWEHFISARLISITSFYLALPAIALLLGRLGLSRCRRWFALALLLLCPVYIFYTRAFLIDPMEFMCCAWFLAAFVRTMDERSWRWWLVTAVAGVGAALIKGFMLAVWLLPAAGYGAWVLWRDLRARSGWRVPARTIAWGLGCVALPFAALKWWIGLTDPYKAAHPSAWIFTSKNLSVGNWGLFNFSSLFSREVWRTLMDRWSEAIMPPWLILGVTVLGLIAVPRARGKLALIAGVFFLSQALFPFAYAYQDYYYYSCAVFLVVGFGVLALELWDSAAPRWLVVPLMLVPLVAQVRTYWGNYRAQQSVVSQGWTSLTLALKDLTPPGSVIVMAGYDWAAMTPYYSERRALMIRNGLEYDEAYLERAFKDLADEDVSALIVTGKPAEYAPFMKRALAAFDMEEVPTFRHDAKRAIYLRRLYVQGAHVRLRASANRYGAETTIPPHPEEAHRVHDIPAPVARTAFPNITPGPFKCDFEFGYLPGEYQGAFTLSTNADSVLWLRPPAEARGITWEFGLYDPAWMKEGDKSNGMEFVITGELSDGSAREIFRRVLDPVNNAKDRGVLREQIAYTPLPGEVLRFSALGNGSKSYDWGFIKRIEVK